MLGLYAHYSREYLLILMILTTTFFALPLFIAPLTWARLMRWDIPEKTHLAIYFGRCLGAFILLVECTMLRAVVTGTGFSFVFDVLFVVFVLMFFVHVYGALRRIQPITETVEIAFWLLLFGLNIVFYPSTELIL